MRWFEKAQLDMFDPHFVAHFRRNFPNRASGLYPETFPKGSVHQVFSLLVLHFLLMNSNPCLSGFPPARYHVSLLGHHSKTCDIFISFLLTRGISTCCLVHSVVICLVDLDIYL
jgi:hypothetical protein